jgi:LuxR family maltose regulon positive regulatory protein
VEVLINEISLAEKPFLIALDDYHLIKKVEVHSIMQLLLKRQPEALHLVIITREDPPFSLPRMRVQGQITEIRERELRFTLSEAQAFLVKTMGLELSERDVDKLEERTEGWAAGIQLAALAIDELTSEEDRRAFIEAFAGSNKMIVDYLISEVLQRQAETTRRFLLRTSILERFCAELCDRVVFSGDGEGSSQSVLDILEQGNMFLVPLDNQRCWYRYHHLFSEMLFHSLRRASPDEIPALHRKAGEWFEAEGLIPEAMKHALASKDWDFVAALLDRQAYGMLIQGYGNLVIEWCRGIPKTYMEKSPNLCIYDAWALVLTFRNDFLGAVEEKLQMAERALENPDLPLEAQVGQGRAWVVYKDWVAGHLCVIRSQILLALFNSFVDPQELIYLSARGLELLPEVELTFRSTCRINLAIAQLMQNNARGAHKPLEEALAFSLDAGNILGVVTVIVYQARLAYYMGQLDQAASLCQQWKMRFAEMGGTTMEIPATRGLDIMLGFILLERNQLEAAERLFAQALQVLGWASWIELHGFLLLARVHHLQDNEFGVQETLQRMSKMGPQHAACAEAYQVWYAIKRLPDDPKVRARAENWTETHVPNTSLRFALGIGPYHRDTEYYINLAWARIQIALGHSQDASIFISPALEDAREQGLLFRVIELSIALALAHDGQGNPSAALDELEKALEIGERYGYGQVFDDSPQLDRLLQKAAARKIHAQYARQLLTAFESMRGKRKTAGDIAKMESQHPSLVDPLSERELEVLQLLASGLPTSEVAKKLFLSPFTLKAHTQNIYTKLGVHSRIEAINKARELGLL